MRPSLTLVFNLLNRKLAHLLLQPRKMFTSILALICFLLFFLSYEPACDKQTDGKTDKTVRLRTRPIRYGRMKTVNL